MGREGDEGGRGRGGGGAGAIRNSIRTRCICLIFTACSDIFLCLSVGCLTSQKHASVSAQTV